MLLRELIAEQLPVPENRFSMLTLSGLLPAAHATDGMMRLGIHEVCITSQHSHAQVLDSAAAGAHCQAAASPGESLLHAGKLMPAASRVRQRRLDAPGEHRDPGPDRLTPAAAVSLPLQGCPSKADALGGTSFLPCTSNNNWGSITGWRLPTMHAQLPELPVHKCQPCMQN